MHVEIWSDVACPWCYIGMRRFEVALARFEHRHGVEVTWRSFELDPGAPAVPEGDRVERLARKYGTTREVAEERQRQITELAAADGLEMRFELVARRQHVRRAQDSPPGGRRTGSRTP